MKEETKPKDGLIAYCSFDDSDAMMDDIHDFLDIYEKLLNEGENLENGDNRLLAYLSIVEL